MTDEERQKLCNDLRNPNWFQGPAAVLAKDAADEIEQLAKELAKVKEALKLWTE